MVGNMAKAEDATKAVVSIIAVMEEDIEEGAIHQNIAEVIVHVLIQERNAYNHAQVTKKRRRSIIKWVAGLGITLHLKQVQ